MFGIGKRRTRPAGATVVTHSAPRTKVHRTSPGGGLMARLRPRRNIPPTHGVAAVHTTRAPRSRRTGFGRSKRAHPTRHHHTTATTTTHHTTAVPARKPSMGDKLSGAMLKLRGSLSGRPGQKAAGTRRMHGTDGRTRRYY